MLQGRLKSERVWVVLRRAAACCGACTLADRTVKKSPPTFVQAGPMDPWALMQKALLDALVL